MAVHLRLLLILAGLTDGTTVSNNRSVFTVTMSELRTESSGWYLCVKGDLQMPVNVTFTDRPTKQDLRTSSDISSAPSTQAEEEVIYCNVRPKRKSSSQLSPIQRSYAGSDVDVTYSSVTPIKQQNVEAEDDDVTKRVFTVTINYLTGEDTGDYWCAVEIDDGADLKDNFHLSVTGGSPSLYVDQQEIRGFKGDNMNIKCHCQNSGEIKWCRLGGPCVTLSGSKDGTRVDIGAHNPGVLTVTLSGLRTESSGWYWCVKGDLQMPVHITVTEKPTTIAATGQINTVTPTSKPVNHTSSSAEQGLSTVEVEQQSVSVNLMVFIIPLSSLIFIVTVASFICLMIKRHKQTKGDSPATIMGKEEVTYSTVKQRRKTSGQLHRTEEEVTYSDVKQRKPTDKWSDANRDVDVMYSDVIYSSVVTIEHQTGQRIQAEEDDVTYSRNSQLDYSQ
ncbi:hypothetical protein NQZ68_003003 [Dissostichus eleginoides]|nr:hypothetical protein NQZ68_003003 [Dissostichus eleginoides]